MLVPFNDLAAQYLSVQSEIDAAIQKVIQTSQFIRGEHVDNFETAFAKKLGVEHCVSCANGTDAIFIALKALGLKTGDEVLVPAHSWIASSETVSLAGGTVVFCDTEARSFNIDINSIKKQLSKKTVGIIVVHMAGQPARMDAICAFAEANGLWVLEDCAQAHFASFNEKHVGTFGVVGTYSFYPGKNLGAMGDAGAIVTNDTTLADRMRMFAQHGSSVKGNHEMEGINSRLDGLQAAILNVKLRHLVRWTKRRRAIANFYQKNITPHEAMAKPVVIAGAEPVWHLYMLKHESRDRLRKFLFDQGIETRVHYPCALPFLPAYKQLKHKQKDFPCAYENQNTMLSLPIFPEMTEEQMVSVVDFVNKFNQQEIK